MSFSNHNFIIRLLLIIEFVLLGLACVLVHVFAENNPLLLTIVCTISGCIFTYSIQRYRQTKKMSQYLHEVVGCLDFLSNETDDHIVLTKNKAMLLPYYEKIEAIRERYLKIEDDRQRILSIVNSVAVNMEIESLLEDLLPKLIEATKSNCGVFYLANNSTNKLEIKKSIGFSKNIYSEFDLLLGEGFIGLTALSKEIKIITDIPADTIYSMRTFLGKMKPKNMMIVPIVNQDQLVGVFAFSSIYEYSDHQVEMVNLIKYYVGAAVGNGLTFEKTKRLTNELKFQNRLIQNLNDDLEMKVQDRTAFLNDIIDSIKDYAIYAMDKDGIVLVWNKGAEILFGYKAEETIGKHINNVYPADEVQAGYVQKRIDSVTRDGRYVENGWRFRKDGSGYYAEMMLFSRYDQNGNIIGFTNVTKDITFIKNLESDLWFEKEFSAKLIESSSQALVITDEDGFVQTSNPKAVELLGANLTPGQRLYDFFEETGKLRENIESMVETCVFGEWSYKLKHSDKNVNISASILTNDVNYSRILLFNFL